MIPWYYRTEDLEELQKKILEDINYVEVIFCEKNSKTKFLGNK